MDNSHTVICGRDLARARPLIALLAVLALTGIHSGPGAIAGKSKTAAPVAVLQTTPIPMLAGTHQVIANNQFEEIDSSIDCSFVAYTEWDFELEQHIRYFTFATSTLDTIPGNNHAFADVFGGRIAFNEATFSGTRLHIFDIASQTSTTVPRLGVVRPAIGENLVAFEDYSASTGGGIPFPGEITVFNLLSGAFTQLTNDALFDRNPSISSTGNVVTWEKCETSTTGCDIFAAVQTAPGIFNTTAITGASGEDLFPVTNGEIVAYASTRDGETDVYFQPASGDVETRVAVPGRETSLNIAGEWLVFRSFVSPEQADIFLYNIKTANLYQVTNTPASEVLPDIAICGEVGRITYSVPAPGTGFDVWVFTFQVPSPTVDQIEDLIALVQSFGLPEGLQNSLIIKLQDALAAIADSDAATACEYLTAFINECAAQSGKKLAADQSSQLANAANAIKSALGCQ